MQVFLPTTSVRKSFNSLDLRRLNKQHLELHQLITCVDKKQRGEPTSHHAAVNLFMDHIPFLRYCFATCVHVCIDRGINIQAYREEYEQYRDEFRLDLEKPHCPRIPEWFGNKAFHAAHRQALLAKSRARYLKACDASLKAAEGPYKSKLDGVVGKIRNEYVNAVAEYEWYRGFGWAEDVNTTVYHYCWWDYKNSHVYIGPTRNAMEE